MAATAKRKEYPLNDGQFNELRHFVKKITGISLSDAKKEMIYRRISPRLDSLGMKSFSQYCKLLASENTDELEIFSNAVTTNLTSFYREKHHFEYLEKTVIPEILQRKKNEKKIRVWSAGCSTGEEPYSIAMSLKKVLPAEECWDVKILASDLDTGVLSKAARGVYEERRIAGLDNATLDRWFIKKEDNNKTYVKVRPEIQKNIRFRPLNLMHSWPFKNKFDIIFCRNVMIYFDQNTQENLLNRFASHHSHGGVLFIGHSEMMHGNEGNYQLIGKTIYKRKGQI